MDVLVFNKNCHLVTIFKDYMILDYIDEFLKRYYTKDEITIKILEIKKIKIILMKDYLKMMMNLIVFKFQNLKLKKLYLMKLLKNKLMRIV